MILLSPVDYSKPSSASREEQGFVFTAQNAPTSQTKNNPEGNSKEPTGIFSRLENTGKAVSIKWFLSLNNHYDPFCAAGHAASIPAGGERLEGEAGRCR